MVDTIDSGIYRPTDLEKSALGKMERRDISERTRNIPREEWEKFARGMTTLYNIVFIQERPDVIIAPMRGAAPLIWALELMAAKTEKPMPMIERLPLGTSTDMYDAKMKGLKGKPKQSWLKFCLEGLHELHERLPKKGGKRINKVMLLDEARTGGTITQAAFHIQDLKREWREKNWDFDFVVIMAQDLPRSDQKVDKAIPYLMANNMGKSYKIPISLPFMDVNALLPLILRQNPQVREKEGIHYEDWELLEVYNNEKAERLFKEKVAEYLGKIHWPEHYQDAGL